MNYKLASSKLSPKIAPGDPLRKTGEYYHCNHKQFVHSAHHHCAAKVDACIFVEAAAGVLGHSGWKKYIKLLLAKKS